MGSKRTMILIAALVIGAVAAFSLYSYVNGVENKAYDNADRVPVYVVKEDIPANTSGQQVLSAKAIAVDQVPREFMPQTAITDPSTIVAKFSKTDLVKGQVVVASMFVDKKELTSTWRDQLGTDVAIQVQLDQVKGMSGIIQPGDKVTMLVSLDGSEAPVTAATTADAVAAGGKSAVRFLYSNVQVMAIGSTGVDTSGNAAVPTGGPIMFRVPLKAAEKIALAGSKIYLVLEPENFVPGDADLAPVDWDNLFGGEKSPYPNGSDAKSG